MAHIFGLPHSVKELFGGIAQAYIPKTNFVSGFSDEVGPFSSAFELGEAAYDSFGAPGNTTVVEAVVDNSTGECLAVKKRKKRRRRRRLSTASDIKDIASLKSVLTGKQLETWLATHSH